MKNKKVFTYVLEYAETTGQLTCGLGLCGCIDRIHGSGHVTKKVLHCFNLFEPNTEDCEELNRLKHNLMYWASGSRDAKLGIATDLRKTILAFMAVFNNEV